MSVVIRTSGNPLSLASAVRQAVWTADRSQTLTEVTTLEGVVGGAVARPGLIAWLLALFGASGLARRRGGPSDPVTFVEVVLARLGAPLLASWLPARRALRIDLVVALRAD